MPADVGAYRVATVKCLGDAWKEVKEVWCRRGMHSYEVVAFAIPGLEDTRRCSSGLGPLISIVRT